MASVETVYKIPQSVKNDAAKSLKLVDAGFEGGTQTGWARAEQLVNDSSVNIYDLATMRAWYARHGPDAKNGGTSYPGYLKWVDDGSPMRPKTKNDKKKYRGAVAWLLWGGDAAYLWLKTKNIRDALLKAYPNRKQATPINNLKN